MLQFHTWKTDWVFFSSVRTAGQGFSVNVSGFFRLTRDRALFVRRGRRWGQSSHTDKMQENESEEKEKGKDQREGERIEIGEEYVMGCGCRLFKGRGQGGEAYLVHVLFLDSGLCCLVELFLESCAIF